jgi:hypothetical protein
MNALIRGLTWPIVSLLIVGGSHLIGEMARPELQQLITPAVVMPIYLVAGGWAGYATVRAGGTFGHGLVAGAILGLLPLMLQVVGFGLILGRDSSAVTTSGIFGLLAIFWAGAIGSGIAEAARARVGETAAAPAAFRSLGGEARSS